MEVDNIIKNLLITDIADEGLGIGKHDGLVVFVEGAVPGDVLDVKVWKKKKSFANAKIAEIIQPSLQRVHPFCQHFGICGGCKWQYFDYAGQLHYKQKQVYDALTRIAKIEDIKIEPIIGSDVTRYYRNKLEFTFSNKRYLLQEEMNTEIAENNALGFHIPRRFDKILDIENCYLQDDFQNQLRNFVREFCLKNKYSFSNVKEHSGLMRNMIVRNTSLGEWMLIMVFRDDDQEKINLLLNAIKEQFSQITSLVYIINNKKNDTVGDLPFALFNGTPYITEQLENLKFRIGPHSFFQTNSSQTLKLYSVARDFAQLTGNENVYDLYTGTGTIAQFVADKAKYVTGIEYVAASIEDAKANASLNNINNTRFFAGDMKDLLTESFFEANGKPDVIITDPPRNGMHADVTHRIANSGAQRIVYVSCNAATQARDIEILKNNYRLTKVQPVDMFPHTSHVENVVAMERIINVEL